MKTDMNQYQAFVARLMGSAENDRSTFALGLAGEAGEVCDLLKKHWGHLHPLDVEKLKKELGDVLWYVAALAEQFDLKLEDVAQANVAKLVARYPEGKFSPEASMARVDVERPLMFAGRSGAFTEINGAAVDPLAKTDRFVALQGGADSVQSTLDFYTGLSLETE